MQATRGRAFMQNLAVFISGRSGPFLQKILFGVVVEDGVLLPAKVVEGLADELFYIRSDGTTAVVIFVVKFPVGKVDEVILDGTLQTAWHVVVHPLEAEGHADWFDGTILGAVCFLSHWIPEIYGLDNRVILRNIVHQDAAKAVLFHGTILTLAHSIVLRHFAELVIPGLDGVGFHCFVFMFNIIMFAKLRRFYEVCKFFTKKY